MLFQKKKAIAKGKNINEVDGELLSLVGDDLPWKLTLGRDATFQVFTLMINGISFMELELQ